MQGRYIARGLLDSLAVGAGYVPVAISFGVAAMAAGLSPVVVVLISVLVFAGASQFILIALLVSGASWWVTLTAVVLMNARHFFYGPALYGQLNVVPRRLPLPLWAFGLTDEVFAASVSRLGQHAPQMREAWYFGMQLGAYLAWVGGTVLGVLFEQLVQDAPLFVREALNFVLPALFLALLLEMRPADNWLAMLGAVAVCLALSSMLAVHTVLILAILAGILLSMLRRPEGRERVDA